MTTDEILVELVRADEALREESKDRDSFRYTSPFSRNPILRHNGFYRTGHDHPFIHVSRQDIEDLKEAGLIRVRVQKNRIQGPGRKTTTIEQWLVDVTQDGYERYGLLVAATRPVNNRLMDAEGLTRLRSQRFTFLRAVYDKSGGNRLSRVRIQEIAADLNLDEDEAHRIADYLIGESLLEWAAMGGLMAITHWGIKEIEEAIAAPNEETEHFPPLVIAENYIHVGSMVGSSLQQGTQDSVQILASTLDLAELKALVDEIREALRAASLSEADQEEAGADLATLDAQIASPRLKPGIVRESLSSLKRIMEGAMGAGVASGAPHLPQLAERVAHMLTLL
jgi:hypothetical protein